jgi:hypothetical protein
MAQQYNNYNQVGYGNNPYDQRDDAPSAGRYNNYSQGRYDDRTFKTRPIRLYALTHHSRLG